MVVANTPGIKPFFSEGKSMANVTDSAVEVNTQAGSPGVNEASSKLANEVHTHHIRRHETLNFGNDSNFLKASESLLRTLDADSFSKRNMARAVRDPNIVGVESEVLAALYGTYFHFHGYSNSTFNRESINRGDLRAINDDVPRASQAYKEQVRVENYLGRIPEFYRNDMALQKDYFESELKRTTDDADKETLNLILNNFDKVAIQYRRPSGPPSLGISLSEVQSYTATMAGRKATTAFVFMDELERSVQADLANPRSLYGTEMARESIVPQAVRPAVYPDNMASFYAGLVAMAKQHPEQIEKMIKANDDGSFNVKFPGLSRTIKVAAPTETELALFDRTTSHGYWPAVLDKAYGQYLQSGIFGSWQRTPQEAVDKNSEAKDVMQVLTGKKPWYCSTKYGAEPLIGQLIALGVSQNASMIATAPRAWLTGDGTRIEGGTQAIVGYDPKGSDGGTVTLMHPFDTTKTTTISLLRFKNVFKQIVVESSGI